MTEESNKTATTVREVGIELAGFKELTSERFNTLEQRLVELTQSIKDMAADKADQKDLDLLDKRVEVYRSEHENFVTKRDFAVGLGVVSILLSIAVTILNFWDKLKP